MTPTLTTALTNALPVLQEFYWRAYSSGHEVEMVKAMACVDKIYDEDSDAAKTVIQVLEMSPWFREGQPVIDELKRFL